MKIGVTDMAKTRELQEQESERSVSHRQVPVSQAASKKATAVANANIALIKYWGKADERLIIPRASSLSLTLEGLSTRTTVEFVEPESASRLSAKSGSSTLRDDASQVPDTVSSQFVCSGLSSERASASNAGSVVPDGSQFYDSLTIDGKTQQGSSLARVSKFLDIVRDKAGIALPACVTSSNTVPFGAGLASSASAFAALAAAASKAAGLELSPRDLSRLARRGSGSACRSVFGGLVKWNAGHDDESSYAEPVDAGDMDLAIIVVLITSAKKPISSREAMRRTIATSPLYDAWIDSCGTDMDDALAAIRSGDVQRLGEITEANALGMHAAMMASRPAVFYWLPQTVAALKAVASIRADDGLGAWSTMDAGPNVKVLADGRDAERVADELRNRLPGCEIAVHRPGAGVRFLD
ncbi:diphosphomevalonate decarboxylase [Bifidobacterium sp. ESL0704]|uniref:diphosphomevalonate decarboxylase n=1 Tax=Bifidobacterium sp. ESL0704 TaxID=2983219 RepID=UPI0023F7D7EC|nr:diphosphomevalonate decarboxylase [Bifidobacterium sp. ESL0704]WEV53137.1 diphosphomevalonate decarboxylase [Bifidobacterium sp. ESL0704]